MHLIIGKDKEETKRVLGPLLNEKKAPLYTFFPDNFSIPAFFQETETLLFLSKEKIIVIHDVDQLAESALEAICRYLERPNPWISLFLTASEMPPRNRLTKLIEKQGTVTRFKEEKAWEKEKRLAEWVIEEAKKEKIRLSMQAAVALVQGVDHQMLKSELDKLLCFASSRQEITLEDIALISTPAHHETLWQLGDALLAREKARALEIGLSLLEEGTAIFLLLASLRSQFSTALEIYAAAEAGEVEKRFPYLKGKFLEKKVGAIKKYGKTRLSLGLLAIFETEVKAKNSAIDPTLLLELLIIKLTHDFVFTPQFAGACS